MGSHEDFVQAVATQAIARLPETDRKAFDGIKLVYGAGATGLRGITYYNRWTNGDGDATARPFVEVCAMGEEGRTQLAGTTIHELAHVLAGFAAGHSKEWKNACKRLGLRNAMAQGHAYHMSGFDPDIRHAIAAMPPLDDGAPVRKLPNGMGVKPCVAGIGTRGGTSRGVGSGSRLIKCACGSCGYTARVTRKWLAVGAPHCPSDGHGAMQANEV
jgi:hypothetical protein